MQDGTDEERLATYVSWSIRSDRSVVYGDGFRAALAAFQHIGLRPILEHLRTHDALPPTGGV